MTRTSRPIAWVPVGVAAVAAVAAVVFHRPLIAWFSGADEASAERPAVVTEAGGLRLALSIEPDPPSVEDNRLSIALTDTAGEPVARAEVAVTATMPAMASMPEMRAEAEIANRGSGRFRGELDLRMTGTWTLEVSVEAGGRTLAARYAITTGTRGVRELESSGTTSDAEAVAHAYAEPALAALRDALTAYEGLRDALAGDSVEGLPKPADSLAASLRAASRAAGDAPPSLRDHLTGGARAAAALGAATSLEAARNEFAALSSHVLPLAVADPRLMDGQFVYECSMTRGYNKWLQPSKHLANPYQGSRMLTCGVTIQPETVAAGASAGHAHAAGEVAFYTCPMHTWVKEQRPGTCPVCAMDLTPVTQEEVRDGVIRLDHDRRQLIGVRMAKVERRPLAKQIHAVGEVTYDESRIADVTLKYSGWIEKLHVDETGQRVRRGQPLLLVYSPELYAAQQDYLLALRQVETARTDEGRARLQQLASAARARLLLLDLTEAQIGALAASGEPRREVSVRAPVSGFVVDKSVVDGAAVGAGERLFRIADLDRVWVEAEVYEQDIPLVKVGQTALVTLSHLPGKRIEGTVGFVYPYLHDKTRTARLRIELANPELALKPDMYAEVDIAVDLGERLVVPESAIIYSGPRRLVFVDIGGDRFKPVVVETGVKSGSFFEVLSGLEVGDEVVVSGNFLVTAESRLKSATGLW